MPLYCRYFRHCSGNRCYRRRTPTSVPGTAAVQVQVVKLPRTRKVFSPLRDYSVNQESLPSLKNRPINIDRKAEQLRAGNALRPFLLFIFCTNIVNTYADSTAATAAGCCSAARYARRHTTRQWAPRFTSTRYKSIRDLTPSEPPKTLPILTPSSTLSPKMGFQSYRGEERL